MAKKSLLGRLLGEKGKKRKRVVKKPKVKRKVIRKMVVRKIKPIRIKPRTEKKTSKKIKPMMRAGAKKEVRKKIIAKPAAPAPAAAKAAIAKAERMADDKAFLLLKTAKIPVAPFALVKKERDIAAALKKTGLPCVMKVSGKNIMHRTEVNGVKKNISSAEAATEAFKQLIKIKNCEKVLLQKQLEGVETIVGVKHDEQFGEVILFGLGGMFTELLKDVSIRVCPISQQDAKEMVREIKGYEILSGTRGQKPIAFSALEDVLVKVSRLAVRQKIKEMDINPLFCYEQGCTAADVRIIKK